MAGFDTKTLYKQPVKVYRRTSYPAISSDQESLSLAGKNVLMIGGGQGIGRGIVDSYVKAKASNLIIVSRNIEKLQKTKTTVEEGKPRTAIHVFAGSITEQAFVQETFAEVRKTIGDVDIVILASVGLSNGATFEATTESMAAAFDTSVFGMMNVVRSFLSVPSTVEKPKIIIELSSLAAHAAPMPNQTFYSVTKAASTRMLSCILQESQMLQTQPGLRVHSFHPGAVLTDTARDNGFDESTVEWDHLSLPSDYAVYLASDKADFLNGRFTWCNWDVEEVEGLKDQLLASPTMFTINLTLQ